MTKILGVNPIVQRITQLRNEVVYSAVEGNYKNYKNALKEYAKLSVENFELSQQVGSATLKNIPTFSKTTMRILKVFLLNLFRIKTPEEKQLRTMLRAEEARKEAQKYMTRG